MQAAIRDTTREQQSIGTHKWLMIILTNLQAEATCNMKVLGVHTYIRKYWIYQTAEFGIDD